MIHRKRVKQQRQKEAVKRAKKRASNELRVPRINAKQLARIFAVSQGLVSTWLNEGLPAIRPGRSGAVVLIDLMRACPWILARTGEAAPDSALGIARVRFETARAEKFELENARRRGELVLLSYVSEIMNEMAADLGARLDAISGRCANEFAGITDPALLRQRLLQECRAVRLGAAEHVLKLANTPPAGEASS